PRHATSSRPACPRRRARPPQPEFSSQLPASQTPPRNLGAYPGDSVGVYPGGVVPWADHDVTRALVQKRRSIDCCRAARACSRLSLAFCSGFGFGLGCSDTMGLLGASFHGCYEGAPSRPGSPVAHVTPMGGRVDRVSRPSNRVRCCRAPSPRSPASKRISGPAATTPRRGAGLLEADPAAAAKDEYGACHAV